MGTRIAFGGNQVAASKRGSKANLQNKAHKYLQSFQQPVHMHPLRLPLI